MAINFCRQCQELNKILKECYLDNSTDFSLGFDFYPDSRTDLWGAANSVVVYLLSLIRGLLEEKKNH